MPCLKWKFDNHLETDMQILAIISGEYGQRHVRNIRENGPDHWVIHTWQAPTILPPVIDYPEDYLPDRLPQADLILSFAEHKGIAELLPDIAEITGARAVLAAIDNEAWLPRGLARQLLGWLKEMGVACVTPKPLCSLTEEDFALARRHRQSYSSPLISEFARHFGQPEFDIQVNPEKRCILSADVKRDTVCGCARHVAEGLVGVSVDEAEEVAGLRHHHYPCLASMGIDPDYGDTLMHASGNILKDQISSQIKAYKQTGYISPGKRSE
jgi:hypothetical protein